MKRQRGSNSSRLEYKQLIDQSEENDIPMGRIRRTPIQEHTIEAQIQEGDTLQAIALRFNCTVAELKRLNKIEKEYEIHARKTLKVPITPHTLLLEHIPSVHRSGHSSPKKENSVHHTNTSNQDLNDKLLSLSDRSINDIILNTEITRNTYADDESHQTDDDSTQINSLNEHLLSGVLDDSIPQPRPITRRPDDFSCSGSDCDMSWICLFICILALCFAIPLIYVFYIAEHLKEFQHNGNTVEITIKNVTDRSH